MWGFGGRYYWGKKDWEREKSEGIVVVFAWMSSQEKHLKNYVELYSSMGWNSLVCHSQFLNMFFPDKAATIARDIVNELLKVLKVSPQPVVFASFSGGPKACMYKVLQMIDRTWEVEPYMEEYQLIRDCFAGHIYDSSPVDFTSDLGSRFVVHPSVLKISHPPKLVTWLANGVASGLDALFLSRFESHRAEYWQTLYSSVSLGAPYLILCSETDDLAPYQIIHNFAQRLEELGGDVKLLKWNGSPHVGHYRNYPDDYKAAVKELLHKAATIYSQRITHLEGKAVALQNTSNVITEQPMQNLKRTASTPNNMSFNGTPLVPDNHSLSSTSLEFYQGGNSSVMKHEQTEGLIHFPTPRSITAHGVLGRMLFDACVPENVEDWDIKSSDSLNAWTSVAKRRHIGFNPINCIRRSRL